MILASFAFVKALRYYDSHRFQAPGDFHRRISASTHDSRLLPSPAYVTLPATHSLFRKKQPYTWVALFTLHSTPLFEVSGLFAFRVSWRRIRESCDKELTLEPGSQSLRTFDTSTCVFGRVSYNTRWSTLDTVYTRGFFWHWLVKEGREVLSNRHCERWTCWLVAHPRLAIPDA